MMSCNGCRILRKGCNENCIIRQSIECIESPQAQANATLFVAKFFGRAGLISFLSSVPHSQRPALFQSLLFEACGRTVNPVNGAVGLLWTGNWHVCQSAVETVLGGGVLRPLPDHDHDQDHSNNNDDLINIYSSTSPDNNLKKKKKKLLVASDGDGDGESTSTTLDLGGKHNRYTPPATPSDHSDTTTFESHQDNFHQTRLLHLFS